MKQQRFSTFTLSIVWVLVTYSSIAQGLPLPAADTANTPKPVHGSAQPYIISGALITIGAISIKSHLFISNSKIKEERDKHFSGFSTSVDDYLQYAPVALAYGMLINNKEHRFWPYTKKLILAELIMTATVSTTKNWVGEKRPDSGSPNAFPSGHTAQAFTGATLFCDEFARHNFWLAATVYTSASAVGVLRVLNNRHWGSDVIAGAGFGILSAKISEWIIEPHGRKTQSLFSQKL